MRKNRKILNPALLRAIAALGVNEYLVIADSSFPVEKGIPLIDLSLVAGVPSFEQVLLAVKEELVIDSYITASEMADKTPEREAFLEKELAGLQHKAVLNEQLKVLAKHARAVVRTGECTPYASVILVGGTDF